MISLADIYANITTNNVLYDNSTLKNVQNPENQQNPQNHIFSFLETNKFTIDYFTNKDINQFTNQPNKKNKITSISEIPIYKRINSFYEILLECYLLLDKTDTELPDMITSYTRQSLEKDTKETLKKLAGVSSFSKFVNLVDETITKYATTGKGDFDKLLFDNPYLFAILCNIIKANITLISTDKICREFSIHYFDKTLIILADTNIKTFALIDMVSNDKYKEILRKNHVIMYKTHAELAKMKITELQDLYVACDFTIKNKSNKQLKLKKDYVDFFTKLFVEF